MMRYALRLPRTRGLRQTIAAALFLLLGPAAPSTPVRADDAGAAADLVEEARLTFERFQTDPEMGSSVRALVQRAKGVLIVPRSQRGGPRAGKSGNGVFVARHQTKDMWTGPAFYALGRPDAGTDVANVLLIALTDRGVSALLTNGGTLGDHASVGVGPAGVGAETGGGDLRTDLVSYSRRHGLRGGISMAGIAVTPLDALARAYYGQSVTPTQILLGREVVSSQAAGLMAALDRVTGGSASTQRAALQFP